MSDTVSKENCNDRHEAIKDKFERHEAWLGEHEQKIDRLDRSDAANTQAITNLAGSIKAQTKAIWGLVVIVATGLVGFFFYAVEKGIFK